MSLKKSANDERKSLTAAISAMSEVDRQTKKDGRKNGWTDGNIMLCVNPKVISELLRITKLTLIPGKVLVFVCH